MRVWADLTNSPHVLVLRPLSRSCGRTATRWRSRPGLRADARAVRALRDRAHGGGSPPRRAAAGGKGLGLASRSLAALRWARGRRFDVAIGHGSNDVRVAAALLRIPSATAFDYEFASRAAQRELPALRARWWCPRRSRRSGSPLRRGAEAPPLRGPEGGVLPRRLRARRGGAARALARHELPIVIVRTPPDVSLYHRFENPLFGRCSTGWPREGPRWWCCRARPEQREEVAGRRRSRCPSGPSTLRAS